MNGNTIFVRLSFTPLNGKRKFNYPARGEKAILSKKDYRKNSRVLTIAKNFKDKSLERLSAYSVVA